MDASFFQFQQFAVRQRDSAMKIGTDGVLLGAWSEIDSSAKKVLDIGTGTGLISLMLAQRYPEITIDAIELDQAAAGEATFNFAQSPWAKRLNCTAKSLQDFREVSLFIYDHVICNPPFYQGTYAIKDVGRDQARNHAFLPLIELFAGIGQLLSSQGSCSVILPIEHKKMATHEAEKNGLYLSRFTAVKGNETAPVKRALLSYSRLANSCESTVLTLEIARHQRTKTHQELVADFYLPKP
jgi:tRNA1Val (adenine37-N6)-methyltransferase